MARRDDDDDDDDGGGGGGGKFTFTQSERELWSVLCSVDYKSAAAVRDQVIRYRYMTIAQPAT